MKYLTYWSILDTPSHTIKSSYIALIIALIAGLIWLIAKRLKSNRKQDEKAMLNWITGIFGLLGLSMFFILTFVYNEDSDKSTLKYFNSTDVAQVEGIVSNFQRKHRNSKYGTETIESFTVDSIQFAYGDALFGKFNSFTKTYNNVIYNGQPVRVTYINGSPYGDNFHSILKLEIRQ